MEKPIRFIKQRDGGLIAIGSKRQVKIPAKFVRYKRGISELFARSKGHPLSDSQLFMVSNVNTKHSNCYNCNKYEVINYNRRRIGPEVAAIDMVCLNCGAIDSDVAD